MVLCNAGVWPVKFKQTNDGWETCLQVNYLATFYLAVGLIPLLERTSKSHYTSAPRSSSSRPTLSKPHLSIMTSGLHYMSVFAARKSPAGILQTMNDAKGFNGDERYNETKLMVIWMVKSLAQRLGNSSGIIINGVNPGFVPSSGLVHEAVNSSFAVKIVMSIITVLFGRSIEMGVRGIAWGTLKGEENGAYVVNCKEERGSPFANSPEGVETQGRVWRETIDLLLEIDPTLKENPVVSA